MKLPQVELAAYMSSDEKRCFSDLQVLDPKREDFMSAQLRTTITTVPNPAPVTAITFRRAKMPRSRFA